MSSKLEALSKFITAHPFITIGTILVVDGWVTNLFRLIDNKSREKIIEGEFEEVKKDET